MASEPALQLEDVVFRYMEKGKRNILDHASLTIPAGTLTVLMGGSGCGKSTLAAVAAGLYPENGGYLESGTIHLFGHDLKDLDPQKRAAYLTVLFQNPDLQFCMNTLREEMCFCLENVCVPASEMDGRIDRAAADLGVAGLLDRTFSTLSGGEKQKAALACLYVMESRCVLLDESFANLDAPAARQLLDMLLKMTTKQISGWMTPMRSSFWAGAAMWRPGASPGKLCPSTRRSLKRWACFTPGQSPAGPGSAAQTPSLCFSSRMSASAGACPPNESGESRSMTRPSCWNTQTQNFPQAA